jgi:3-methylcrotonyl-CoA carboxylase alpha subunit
VIESLLIANRGEIARRIIRTARRLGVRTIAVYSDADAGAPHVREADLAVHIGPAPARDSYLLAEKLLAAARQSAADAIHPGYGFLSENADFAEAVLRAGLVWVGAPAAAMRVMAHKDAAKKLMTEAGVPVTPGYLGEDQSAQRLLHEAQIIGFPVMIKAVAGGGGKGMRAVLAAEEFADALGACRREAAASFGNDRVLIEKLIARPRHIEVQVFGDTQGQVVHLFERDCSLQRRHQKVIEEAPAPGLSPEVRGAICATAVEAARAVGYVGAGTVEFIADASAGLRADRIWFMEMNTRLQVEHPVTEAVTGQDLVEWQLRVAAGEPLPLRQEQLRMEGWAMESRLYAENPASGFLPSAGPLRRLRIPEGIRVDSAVEEGGEVSAHYDPLIAKLIAHGPTRRAAATRLARVCEKVEVWPVKTNAAFLARALNNAAFLAGEVDTGFIDRHCEELIPVAEPDRAVLQAAAQALLPQGATEGAHDPWTVLDGFRMAGPVERRVRVQVGERVYLVVRDGSVSGASVVEVGGESILFLNGEAWRFGPVRAGQRGSDERGDGTIMSPLPGCVAVLDVQAGDRVTRGQRLLIVEAMKMEHGLVAPFDGSVVDVRVSKGQQIVEGTLLMRIVPKGKG